MRAAVNMPQSNWPYSGHPPRSLSTQSAGHDYREMLHYRVAAPGISQRAVCLSAHQYVFYRHRLLQCIQGSVHFPVGQLAMSTTESLLLLFSGCSYPIQYSHVHTLPSVSPIYTQLARPLCITVETTTHTDEHILPAPPSR